jgi:hypothetical protein
LIEEKLSVQVYQELVSLVKEGIAYGEQEAHVELEEKAYADLMRYILALADAFNPYITEKPPMPSVMPYGCKCDPLSWAIPADIPGVCGAPRFIGNYCRNCGHDKQCHLGYLSESKRK